MRSARLLGMLAMLTVNTVCLAANDRKSSSNSESEMQNRQSAIVLPLDASTDVCYTMRMYKVKATEHLKGNETGRRGYATCQLARDYQLRSADYRSDRDVLPQPK